MIGADLDEVVAAADRFIGAASRLDAIGDLVSGAAASTLTVGWVGPDARHLDSGVRRVVGQVHDGAARLRGLGASLRGHAYEQAGVSTALPALRGAAPGWLVPTVVVPGGVSPGEITPSEITPGAGSRSLASPRQLGPTNAGPTGTGPDALSASQVGRPGSNTPVGAALTAELADSKASIRRARVRLSTQLRQAETVHSRRTDVWDRFIDRRIRGPLPGFESTEERTQRLQASLTTLDRMTAGDREFLLLDPDGDGRVVEVLGEIDHAKRVVIYVPGFGTTLADYADGTPKAQALAEALAAGSGDSAVIDFLGYDAPDWSPDEILGVAGEQRAAEGAAALADLVASLRSRGVPREQIVVVGHSYGSVVGGLALSEFDLDVAKFVALGSPGLGTGIARRSDLGRPEVEIVAVAAIGDVVRHAPGHGADPANPGFGAETFPTGNSTGHSGYLGGDALRALVAEIAAPS